jgi:outer membrane murein-binding lipoprotein Lpp
VQQLSGRVQQLSGRVQQLSGRVQQLSGRVQLLSGRVQQLSGRVQSFRDQSRGTPTQGATWGSFIESVLAVVYGQKPNLVRFKFVIMVFIRL